jgi:hypothetical protein
MAIPRITDLGVDEIKTIERLRAPSVIVEKRGESAVAVDAYGRIIAGPSTDHASVIQAAINYIQTGKILVKAGTYAIKSPLTLKSGVELEGEGMDNTILVSQVPPPYQMFRHMAPLSRVALRRLTCEAGGVSSAWYSVSLTDSVFESVKFRASTECLSFLVFLDTTQGPDYRNTIINCVFEGKTRGQDMLGSGMLDGSVIAHNVFKDGNGQAIGSTNTNYTRFIGNHFINVGNPIGLEGSCEGNVIEGNFIYNSGMIKLSDGPQHTSRRNAVVGNVVLYAYGGVLDMNGMGDVIANNIIFRTRRYGIEGCFDRCTIAHNILIETNYNNFPVTVGGQNHTEGGIVLLNSSAVQSPSSTLVIGNLLYTSRQPFTSPRGTTEIGYTGGILIDTSYKNVTIAWNTLDNTYESIIDFGTGTVKKQNRGYPTEASGTATIPAGSTSVTVNHGLAAAPSKVLVTPAGNLGAIWVSNITSTSFTINCSTAPTADTAVYWYAEV